MTLPNSPKKHHAKKAAAEGTAVGSLAVLLAVLLQSIRANNPHLPWEQSQDAAAIGAATGILTALFRWLRKTLKHRRKARGNP